MNCQIQQTRFSTMLQNAPILKVLHLTLIDPLPNSLKLNLPNLKYLYLTLEDNKCCNKFGATKFPSLERLYIESKDISPIIWASDRFLANAPKLKSFQFSGKNDLGADRASKEQLYKIVAKNEIFVHLGESIWDYDKNQAILEKYSMAKDPKVFVKYEKMLREYYKWTKTDTNYKHFMNDYST